MLGGACVLPVGLAAPAPSASLVRHPLALRSAAAAARCGAPPRCAFIGDRFLEGMPSYATQGSNPEPADFARPQTAHTPQRSRRVRYSRVRASPWAGRLGGRRVASTS